MPKKRSPAQQQYHDLKQQHTDCLLLFRLGDFYEMFYEDAKIAHRVLGITLTARDKNATNPIPMAGIPHHAVQKYLPILIQAWYKVAMAEQVWEVVPGKIVQREVVEIITPATFIQETQVAANIMLAISYTDAPAAYHLARWDFSLGWYTTKTCDTFEAMVESIQGISPQEIVIDSDFPQKTSFDAWCVQQTCIVTFQEIPFDYEQYLCDQLQVQSLIWYGKALEKGRSRALSLLFSYVQYTQKRDLTNIYTIRHDSTPWMVHLDAITIKNLEIFQSHYEASVHQSLYWVINTCATAMGSRLLHEYLSRPIASLNDIGRRQERIHYYLEQQKEAYFARDMHTRMPDIPRLLTTIVYKKPSPLKVQNMRNLLDTIMSQKKYIQQLINVWSCSQEIMRDIGVLSELLSSTLIAETIREDKHYIVPWVCKKVDTYRHVVEHADDLLLSYQAALVQDVSISNVKLKYVKNQWYYIEITPKDIEKFEQYIDLQDPQKDFVRTSSLKSGQRYVSTYLNDLQQQIQEAWTLLYHREQEILAELITHIEHALQSLYALADAIALVDLASTHALYAHEHQRVRPRMQETWSLSIVWWRHPVVEHFLEKDKQFIPNDVVQSSNDFFHLVTWPNMWWKSTYLRQYAIIILLAHAWLYVPAKEATLPLVDGIFARVWSWDALAKNQSTFMTEMLEMANILHNATKNSCIVLDELWRGTSTYDGLALAKAIVVYMCQNLEAKTLFATHYHELAALEKEIAWFSNWSVSVYENDQQVVFLKKIIQWAANKSYGLDVANLAWLPSWVLALASWYLSAFEAKKSSPVQYGLFSVYDAHRQEEQSVDKEDKIHQQKQALLDELQELSLDSMSPLEVMNAVAVFQQKIDNF